MFTLTSRDLLCQISISPTSERMQCMEVWGGNQSIEKSFEAPGLDIYVHSRPYESSESGGGDIYYLTSCASGRISRLLLADVSGHGESVSDVAITLRDLLRANVNKISQLNFVSKMNDKFAAVAQDGLFATAVVATFFEPAKSLDLSIAGHPYPLYFRSEDKEWVQLAPVDKQGGPSNLPLGVLQNSQYPQERISTRPGDMFLLYSDAFIESLNPSNRMLGISGRA